MKKVVAAAAVSRMGESGCLESSKTDPTCVSQTTTHSPQTGRRVLVPVTLFKAGVTKTHIQRVRVTKTKYTARTTTTVAAAATNPVKIVARALDESALEGRDLPANWDDFKDSVQDPLAGQPEDDLPSGRLAKRNLCMDCPAGANLTRPELLANGRGARHQYCCPQKRKTVTTTVATRTSWSVIVQKRTATVLAVKTFTVKAAIQTISGRLYVGC